LFFGLIPSNPRPPLFFVPPSLLPLTPKTLASHYVREREGRRRGSNGDGNGREGDRRQRRDLDRVLLKCVRGREVAGDAGDSGQSRGQRCSTGWDVAGRGSSNEREDEQTRSSGGRGRVLEALVESGEWWRRY